MQEDGSRNWSLDDGQLIDDGPSLVQDEKSFGWGYWFVLSLELIISKFAEVSFLGFQLARRLPHYGSARRACLLYVLAEQ